MNDPTLITHETTLVEGVTRIAEPDKKDDK